MRLNILRIFKKGNGNLMEILLLGSGLAMGLVLVAKIYFERTYDNFVPNIDRTYKIISLYGEKKNESGYTSGAIAPGIKAYSPMVEVATRVHMFEEKQNIIRIAPNGSPEKGSYLIKDIARVDTSFFEIFPRIIYVGDPHSQMNVKNNAMVSRSFAEKLVGKGRSYMEAVGMMLALDYKMDLHFTIFGIYEDFPANSTMRDLNVLLSMPTIIWGNAEGSNNWEGNDCYLGYVRLRENASIKEVHDGIVKMCNERMPGRNDDIYRKIDFRLASMSNLHMEDPDIHRMVQILSLLAVIVLFAAVMNYILIVISAMVSRSKVMAVHKCFGASKADIYKMIFPEVLIHILFSLMVAAFLVYVDRAVLEELMGTTIASLLKGKSLLVLTSVCVLIFLICGVIHGYIYANVPETAAYRVNKEKNHLWKYGSLFIQFVASAFFLALLLTVIMQYRMMLGADMGYSYDKLVYIHEASLDENQKKNLEQELARLPFVESQTIATILPFGGTGGNYVILPGQSKILFNFADLYSVGDNFLNLMEIPLVDGRYFTESDSSMAEVMVSQRFVERMSEFADWKDGAVGKQLWFSEHSENYPFAVYTVCGVYKDIVVGTAAKSDYRPTIMCYKESGYASYRLIKLKNMSAENIQQIAKVARNLYPDKELEVVPYATEFSYQYADSRRFKDSVMLAGCIVLIITLLGLVGYVRDEANRRRKEIAIRKINGAPISTLINLFLFKIVKVTLPAVIIGSVVAYFVTDHWLGQFAQKIELSVWPYILCAVVVLLLLAVVVVSVTYKAANTNPVKYLKSE